MRSLQILLFSAFMMFALSGCGDKADNGDKNPNPTPPPISEPVYPRLGANFNERISEPLDLAELLLESEVEWVRAFVNIPVLGLKKDSQGKISGIKSKEISSYSGSLDFVNAKKKLGDKVKFIMSLKIPFETYSHLVPEAGTQEMEYLLEACKLFLQTHDLGKNIDILVMGNEPEWENGGDADDYEEFLNIFANQLANWKSEYGWTFDVYAGSLNRVSELANSTTIPAVVAAVNSNPNIAGLDLHIHALRPEQCGEDLEDIRKKYGVTKKLICTEFSMVRALDKYMDQNLGAWGPEYGYDSGMKTYEWLNHIAELAESGNPITEEEFLSFFESRTEYPWGWYRDFYEQFGKYDVYCITGRFAALIGGVPYPYTASARMWDMGAIYSSKLLGVDPNTGKPNPNPLIYPDFMAVKESQNNK